MTHFLGRIYCRIMEVSLKKGNVYEGTVSSVMFPGKGIIEYREEETVNKIAIKGAVPGQKLRFVLTKKRKGKCEGRVEKLLEKSSLEDRNAPCPHFEQCGGCVYQNLSYDNQLELKAGMVKDILDNVCEQYEFEGIIASPEEFGYRNKMEFSFGDSYKDGPLALGMHKKNSFYDIVTTDECKIVHNDYLLVLKTVLEYFQEKKNPFYHKMRHTGYVRHLLVRRAVTTGDMTVNIVTTSENDDDLKELVDRILNLKLEGNICGITHIYNDGLADVVKSDRTEVLYGSETIGEQILGLKFNVSTFSFFQTNSKGAERLYEKVREYVGDTTNQKVFDLYSGTGTIAQIVAPVAEKVVGVEIVEEAVEAAKENALANGLSNCEFIAGDVLRVIDEIEDKPDLIILDPPREGIHPKALDKIIAFGVDKIVYISCKPTSLARDLRIMEQKGYKMIKACAVDMFPQTANVETVAMFKKTEAYVCESSEPAGREDGMKNV